jgi:hypothetical protein
MARTTVRRHRDNIKFMRNPFLPNGNAWKHQLFAWLWLIGRRIIAMISNQSQQFRFSRLVWRFLHNGEIDMADI